MISVYTKINSESCGGEHTMEAYATYLRHMLEELWPGAEVTIETTTHESGVMPLAIDGASFKEEWAILDAIAYAWGNFCQTR